MQPVLEGSSQLPSINQHSKNVQPPPRLFRPYNHFPTSATEGLSRLTHTLNGSRKSAFKPVMKRATKTMSATKLRVCTAVPCFCHLSSALNSTLAKSDQLGFNTTLRDSYELLMNRGSKPLAYSSATRTTCKNMTSAQGQPHKTNEAPILLNPATQYQHTLQGNLVLKLFFRRAINLIITFIKQTNRKKICTIWM